MGHPSEPGAFQFSHKFAVMYISYLAPKGLVRIMYGMRDAKPRNAKTTTEVPGGDARNAPDTSPAPREREGESAPPGSVDPLAPPPVDLARVDLPAPFNDAVLEARGGQKGITFIFAGTRIEAHPLLRSHPVLRSPGRAASAARLGG